MIPKSVLTSLLIAFIFHANTHLIEASQRTTCSAEIAAKVNLQVTRTNSTSTNIKADIALKDGEGYCVYDGKGPKYIDAKDVQNYLRKFGDVLGGILGSQQSASSSSSSLPSSTSMISSATTTSSLYTSSATPSLSPPFMSVKPNTVSSTTYRPSTTSTHPTPTPIFTPKVNGSSFTQAGTKTISSKPVSMRNFTFVVKPNAPKNMTNVIEYPKTPNPIPTRTAPNVFESPIAQQLYERPSHSNVGSVNPMTMTSKPSNPTSLPYKPTSRPFKPTARPTNTARPKPPVYRPPQQQVQQQYVPRTQQQSRRRVYSHRIVSTTPATPLNSQLKSYAIKPTQSNWVNTWKSSYAISNSYIPKVNTDAKSVESKVQEKEEAYKQILEQPLGDVGGSTATTTPLEENTVTPTIVVTYYASNPQETTTSCTNGGGSVNGDSMTVAPTTTIASPYTPVPSMYFQNPLFNGGKKKKCMKMVKTCVKRRTKKLVKRSHRK